MKPVRDVINTRELNSAYISTIVETAQEFHKEILAGDARNYAHILEGWNVVPIFEQPSTRTHDSFIDALVKMGARQDIGISDPSASSFGKEESVADTVDTYVGYGANFIVMRTSSEGTPKWARTAALRSYSRRLRAFAEKEGMIPKNLILPVIFNGGDGSHNHPSQHLLDCAAMKYFFGRFTDLDIGIMNDLGASRVFASQADAAAMLDWRLHLYALPGAEIRKREEQRLRDTGAKYNAYQTFDEFVKVLPRLDVLYVHRYQKNLRDGKALDTKCNQVTRSLLENAGFGENAKVMHARPIDKKIKEIDDSLRHHSWNASDIQSDFGIPTRMAMAKYAIDNRMFSIEGVIKSIEPADFEYEKRDLSDTPKSEKIGQDYTTAYINRGYVIDHIPLGCGSVMQGIIRRLIPRDAVVILSSNVKRHKPDSRPKDVIKIHGDLEWSYELTNLVALFTDPYAKKSCRVSRFVDGKRVEKWELRRYENSGVNCTNEKCVTNAAYGEGVRSVMNERNGIYECSFCHTPQQAA